MKKWLTNNLPWLILLAVAILCTTFIIVGTKAQDGSVTLDGKPAQIEEYTNKFIEESNAALYRIMNEDKPTDEDVVRLFEFGGDVEGLGGSVTLETVKSRKIGRAHV